MTEEDYQAIELELKRGFYSGAEKMIYIMRLCASSGRSLEDAIKMSEDIVNKLKNKAETDEESTTDSFTIDDPDRVH